MEVIQLGAVLEKLLLNCHDEESFCRFMSYQPPDPTYLSLALKYNDVNNFVKNSTQLQTLKNIDQTW